MVILHNALDGFLPGTHLLWVSHLNPLRGAEFFEEAAIFGDETKIGDTLEEAVKFFGLSA